MFRFHRRSSVVTVPSVIMIWLPSCQTKNKHSYNSTYCMTSITNKPIKSVMCCLKLVRRVSYIGFKQMVKLTAKRGGCLECGWKPFCLQVDISSIPWSVSLKYPVLPEKQVIQCHSQDETNGLLWVRLFVFFSFFSKQVSIQANSHMIYDHENSLKMYILLIWRKSSNTLWDQNTWSPGNVHGNTQEEVHEIQIYVNTLFPSTYNDLSKLMCVHWPLL